MDIKTRLEDDKVLGVSLETKKFLNSKGIYTIEEFLNIEESNLPVTRSNFYLAMQHIYKHAYLNQELIYDVLLDKEYGFDKKGIKEFSKDWIKLGILDKLRGSKYIVSGMEEWIQNNKDFLNSDKFSMKLIIEKSIDSIEIFQELKELRESYFSDFSGKIDRDEYKKKTDDLKNKDLKNPHLPLSHSNILKYYKSYIDVKKEKKSKDDNDTYTLMYLKDQINQLISQRDNLDQQINDLQNRVDEILGERKQNGK